MSTPVIFKDLPATFPEHDRFRKPSIVSSAVFHGVVLLILLIVPVLLHETIGERRLITMLVSPIPPPPAPLPPPVEVPAGAPARPIEVVANVPVPDALLMPTTVPREIARIIDEPMVDPSGALGGVPGGVPGGVAGGVLGGVLSEWAKVQPAEPLPPPPPPPPVVAPPLSKPVRAGGDVQEPRLLKVVPPVYPKLASQARVSGTVVLEATLMPDGTVQEIRVISGHPLLTQAAIDSVKQWEYEPTKLNGMPVSVILTAKVHFRSRFDAS
jgi:protein TonB